MHDWRNLSHVRWECKYHVVFTPKFVSTIGYDEEKIRRYLREQDARDKDMDQRQFDFE